MNYDALALDEIQRLRQQLAAAGICNDMLMGRACKAEADLAECQSELADQKLLCVDDEMVVDLPAGFKHRIKFQCDMLPLTDAEFDDYTKSPFGVKNWIRKQLDRLSECEREREKLIGRPIPLTEWQKMEQKLATMMKQRDELRQICRDAYEVWAGSEGIPEPVHASEAYIYQLLINMRDEVKRGLAKLGADKTGD